MSDSIFNKLSTRELDDILNGNCGCAEFIEKQDERIADLEVLLVEAVKTIEFYADRANWRYSGQDRYNNNIDASDSSNVITGKTRDKVGGKRARSFLSKPEVKALLEKGEK